MPTRLALILVSGFVPFVLMWWLPSEGLVSPATGKGTVEILWDRWGIPHIFAHTEPDLFWAYGWSQARSHANLILRCYGESRGRAAEYWGESQLKNDLWMWTNRVPVRAEVWLEQQSPDFRKNLEAFVQGFNSWAIKHPELIAEEVRIVLPVAPVDVLAHALRVIHYRFVASQTLAEGVMMRASAGSSAWALGKSKTVSGHGILLANPHLEWSGMYTFFEAHLVGPHVNAYGVTLVGLPVPVIAFNENLGWTHTVNSFDGSDLYALTPCNEGYAWNGGSRAFVQHTTSIKIKQTDGSFRVHRWVVQYSEHGPVISETGKPTVALRVAGLDRPGMLQQWWDMAKCHSLEQFETVLRRLQIPIFSILYADRAGHVLHLFGGCTPVRPAGSYNWSGIVPGISDATLWSRVHEYDDLPKVVDPPSGWLQNTNDPPWSTTIPAAIDSRTFPEYLAARQIHPAVLFRTISSLRLLSVPGDSHRWSLEEVIHRKHSTRMELADHLLDETLKLLENTANPILQRARQVLSQWDRCANADSRGAVLFVQFARELMKQDRFRIPWNLSEPLTTPRDFTDAAQVQSTLEKTAREVEDRFGQMDIAWGKVMRLRAGEIDLPAQGGPGEMGCFRVIDFAEDQDRKYRADFGDSYVAIVEFSQPVRAMALLSYGNASQPGSPHRLDQLSLLANNQLRPVWLYRRDLLKHLEARELLPSCR